MKVIEMLYKSDIAIGMINEEVSILKNRYSSNEYLSHKESSQLISGIINNTIFFNDPLMMLFSGSIKQEMIEKCFDILEKHGRATNDHRKNFLG